jgi:ABC-2 type transport system permease protein
MRTTWNIFWGALKTHISLTFARPTFQIVIIVQPIIMATIAYMLYRRAGQAQDFVSFVVLGSGIAGMWSAIAFSSAGDLNRERSYGTLSALIEAPAPLMIIMLGKIMANAMLSTLALLISIIFSFTVLGVSIRIAHPINFAYTLVLFLIAVSLFALVLSSIFLLSRSTVVLQNFLEYPILTVTGVLFTVEALPPWARVFGWPIPLTWGAEALRLTVGDSWDPAAFGRAIGIELGLIGFYWVLAVVLFRLIERRVRITATLDVY